MKTTSRWTRCAKKSPPDLWYCGAVHGSLCRWHDRVSSRQMVPCNVCSGDENYISRPVCESTTSICKYHGVGIYVCYMPTRFVGRRVGYTAAVNFPDLTAPIPVLRRYSIRTVPCAAGSRQFESIPCTKTQLEVQGIRGRYSLMEWCCA